MCYSAMVEKDINKLAQEFGAQTVREIFKYYSDLGKAVEGRIYPHSNIAPIIATRDGASKIIPMEYGVYPPDFITKDRTLKRNRPFNARLEKIKLSQSFWGPFVNNRGIIVFESFFEWAWVNRLISSGYLNEEENILIQSKKKVEISFIPYLRKNNEKIQMLVPVLYSTELENWGCAAITTEPEAEISLAGHDRMPISLKRENVRAWLSSNLKKSDMVSILEDNEQLSFAVKPVG